MMYIRDVNLKNSFNATEAPTETPKTDPNPAPVKPSEPPTRREPIEPFTEPDRTPPLPPDIDPDREWEECRGPSRSVITSRS